MDNMLDPPVYDSDDDVCEGDESLMEEVCSSRFLLQSKSLSIKEDSVVLSDSSISYRRYVCHPGAVIVVGRRDDSFLFIRQYRCACKKVFWEFPAGKIDDGESSLEAAKREFREEGGYEADQWSFLGSFYPCVGYSNEKMDLYYASDIVLVGQDTDEGEFVNCFFINLDKVREILLKGYIVDSKTLSALAILNSQGKFSFS